MKRSRKFVNKTKKRGEWKNFLGQSLQNDITVAESVSVLSLRILRLYIFARFNLWNQQFHIALGYYKSFTASENNEMSNYNRRSLIYEKMESLLKFLRNKWEKLRSYSWIKCNNDCDRRLWLWCALLRVYTNYPQIYERLR